MATRPVHLSTRVANTRAVAFYAKHGYAPVIAWGKYVGARTIGLPGQDSL